MPAKKTTKKATKKTAAKATRKLAPKMESLGMYRQRKGGPWIKIINDRARTAGGFREKIHEAIKEGHIIPGDALGVYEIESYNIKGMNDFHTFKYIAVYGG